MMLRIDIEMLRVYRCPPDEPDAARGVPPGVKTPGGPPRGPLPGCPVAAAPEIFAVAKFKDLLHSQIHDQLTRPATKVAREEWLTCRWIRIEQSVLRLNRAGFSRIAWNARTRIE